MELEPYDLFVLSAGAIAFGMFLLVKGGNWTIESAVYLADRMGASKLLIGFAVVATGTSLPELVVSVNANLSGSAGIAIGNVVGSNIANILLILGVTSLIHQVVAQKGRVLPDIIMMLASTVLFLILAQFEVITRMQGMAMFAVLVAYIGWQYYMGRRKGLEPAEPVEVEGSLTMAKALPLLLAGMAAVAVGAEFLVNGAVVSARLLGVPEAVIGLTVVAFGTSLPELATCIAAAMKREGDVIIGNIVGSNVFNILFILGVAASVKPMPMASGMGLVDYGTMGAATLALSVLLLTSGKLGRVFGVLSLAAYLAFVLWQYRSAVAI